MEINMTELPLKVAFNAEVFIRETLRCSCASDFYNHQIVDRISNIASTVFIVIVGAIETVIGLGLFVEVILTRGSIRDLSKESQDRLYYPSIVISQLFLNIIRTINLEANFDYDVIKRGKSI